MVPLIPVLGAAMLMSAALVAADRTEQRRAKRPKRPVRRGLPVAAVVSSGTAAYPAPVDPAAEERAFARNLALSGTGLAVAVGASIFAPPYAWVSAAFMIWPLLPVWKDAKRALLKERRLSMSAVDVLMHAGFAATGQWIALALGGTLLSLIRKLIRRAEDHSQRKIVDVFGGHRKTAWVLLEGVEVEVPFDRLAVGDIVVSWPGESMAADGVVVAGTAAVDESLLTGEARPAEKATGDPVLAATTVLSGKLWIRVQRSGAETTAGQIAAVLNRTVDCRRHLQWRWMKLADRMALPTLLSGIVMLPFFGPTLAVAMMFAVGGIGYGMRLIAPIQLFSALHQASAGAVLVKDGRVFERLQDIDTVVFDKTGTLTEGHPRVAAVHAFGRIAQDEVLFLAASLEQRQAHPIAQAILAAAAAHGIAPAAAEDGCAEFGFGLSARIAGRGVAVGSERFMMLRDIPLPRRAAALRETCHDIGHSLVWVAAEQAVVGAIELEPAVRPEARRVTRHLQRAGLTVQILSGDHERPTRHLAMQLGVDGYSAEVLPDGKAAVIAALQKEGRRVCYVGDGVNDSLALRQADVSVSLRGATTIATDTAQVVLMGQTLDGLTTVFGLADRFRRGMKTSQRMVGVPLAVGAGSVLLLHAGLIPVVLLYWGGVGAGIVHAWTPLLLGGPSRPFPNVSVLHGKPNPLPGKASHHPPGDPP